MGTFGTFLLGLVAFLATALIVANPARTLLKKLEGRRPSEVSAAIDEWVENPTWQRAFEVGGWIAILLGLIAIGLIFTFLVEPAFTIAALVRGVGHPIAGYIALVAIFIRWIQCLKLPGSIINARKEEEAKPVVLEDGTAAVGKADEPIKLKMTFGQKVLWVIGIVPDIYLWYLFLISIGVIPS